MVVLNATVESFSTAGILDWTWPDISIASTLKTFSVAFLSLFSTTPVLPAQNILLTNDDGWAVAQIRAQFNAFAADPAFNVALSAPALNNQSLRVSPPMPLTEPCQYNSCPTDSPAEGFNASDPRLNYVNGLPVDSVKFGTSAVAYKLWGGAKPNLIVSGPSIGHNIEYDIATSGTIAAAVEGAREGIPSIAVSGVGTLHEAWTSLTDDPSSASIKNAVANAALTMRLVNALLAQPPAEELLPPGIFLNVNFPSLNAACTEADVQFVFTRAYPAMFNHDVAICHNGGKLPTEDTVVHAGCFASVSAVMAGQVMLNAPWMIQFDILSRLPDFFACFPQIPGSPA